MLLFIMNNATTVKMEVAKISSNKTWGESGQDNYIERHFCHPIWTDLHDYLKIVINPLEGRP